MSNVMNSEPTRTHCIRCGECCLKSSPTLQIEDLPLLKEGLIHRKDLFTIRAGEFAWDPVIGAFGPSPQEFIKIKERKKEGCIFYDAAGKACTIYEKRPVQCVALKCWDPSEFMKVHESKKLTRQDIVEDRVILGLMAEHEKRCGYNRIENAVSEIEREGEKAVQRIIDLLRFDYSLRPFVSEKTAVPLEEMDFLFGRPIIETIHMFGLKVIREPDGSFFLTTAS